MFPMVSNDNLQHKRLFRMIEFQETLEDINNATVWDIYYGNRKVGSLRKELFNKVGKTMHGGKCYLSVFYENYVLPFKVTKKQVKGIVNMNINSLESDAIMNRVNKSEWKESRWITLEKARHTQNK